VTAVLDVDTVRKDFPILDRVIHGDRPLVYLDSAATAQKPRVVLDAVERFYTQHNANVHRGVHTLAEESTALYEHARDTVAAFVGASRDEIIFTKNATEAINLVAGSLAWATGELVILPGAEIVVTEMEHHSNLVPWQLLAQRTGATLRWIGLTDSGRLDLDTLGEVITERTRIVAITHTSNLLGTVNPLEAVIHRAREVGALVLVDAAQAVPHRPVNVAALGADFVAFTGHKMGGPTGVGVLWGRPEILAELPVFLGGGDMVDRVDMASSTYAPVPQRFEAGTPPIASVVGLAAAADYLTGLGMPAVAEHERQLTEYALAALGSVAGVRIIGPETATDRAATISFTVGTIHPHDVGQLLDEQGIAVRVGQHCARPACVRFGVPATVRASCAVYTNHADIDALIAGLDHVRRVFQ
jgi:cysteine desulfurase / selenocysteine lyase